MKRIRTIAIVPTMFTLGNLVCGFFAIVVAARVEPHSGFTLLDSQNVMFSGWLIFLAMVFDALDGQVARLARITSDFGAQLDSLCDMVTFGVAPGFLLVKMCPDFSLIHPRPENLNPLFPGVQTVWVVAAMFAICAALRLARFNVETGEEDDHMYFSGLPSPAAAACVASFAIMFYWLRKEGTRIPYPEEVDYALQMILPFFSATVAVLMVSRIRYPHLINYFVRGNRSFSHLVRLVFCLLAVVITAPYSVPIVCVCFALASPIRYLWEEVVQREPHEEPLF